MQIGRYLGKQLMKSLCCFEGFSLLGKRPASLLFKEFTQQLGPALLPTIHPYGGTIRKVLCLLNQAWLVALHLTMSYLNVEQDSSCFTGEGNSTAVVGV